jgi:ATP dependent DNA ligase domain
MPKKTFPAFVPPMMAESAKAPFDAPDWIFEIKLDGYRAITVFDAAGNPRLWSRNGLPLEAKFPAIAKAIAKLKLRSTILDGEVVAVDDDGIPRFQLLQRFQKQPSAPTLYYAFDVLWYNRSSRTDYATSQVIDAPTRANLGLLLLVTHRLFLVPIPQHKIFSINSKLFVFEEDYGDGSAIDFEIEVIVGRFNFEWAGLNRVDWHLEADCKRIGYPWKHGRTIGSCRRREMLVDRLKCDLNILYALAVFTYHPDADLAGCACLASEESKRSLLPPGAIQDDTIVFLPPCTLRPVIRRTVNKHVFEAAVGF